MLSIFMKENQNLIKKSERNSHLPRRGDALSVFYFFFIIPRFLLTHSNSNISSIETYITVEIGLAYIQTSIKV